MNSYLQSAFARYAILFFACLLFHIIGTWSLPLIDRDEPRFAEASREMIQRGNYIVPFFNNDYRFDKPPLTYWAQTVSYRLFGENDFAARFPSAIAAALIAVALLAWGSRVAGEKAGWWAAIIFTLSLQTFVHAKAAVADMWLVLFMTLAFWSGHELMVGSKHRTSNIEHSLPAAAGTSNWFWWAFYVSLAFAFLAKGPIGFIPLLAVVWTTRRDLQNLRQFAFIRGLALTFAIILLWAVPAYLQTNGEFWRVGLGKHVVGRSLGALEGHGAKSLAMYFVFLPFYFITIFASFFPWSIKLPWLMRKVWNERKTAVNARGYNLETYLFSGIAVVFLIFTLVGTKLPHYTLPTLPLLALLLAHHWSGQTANRLRSIAVAAASVLALIALILPPLVARSFPAYALRRETGNVLKPEMEFGAVEYNEPSLVWYFRSRVNGFMTPLIKKNAAEFMTKAGPRFVILPSAVTETVFPNRPASWKAFSTTGFNVARGKQVELTLLLKPE